MAVTRQKIKTRFKVLFPKVNLSSARLNAYADKLKSKPEDEATDDEIDEIINDFNDVVDFADIARQEDQARSYKAKLDKLSNGADEDEDEDDDEEDILNNPKQKVENKKDSETNALISKLMSKMDSISTELADIKSNKTRDSKVELLKSKFSKNEVISKLTPKMQEKLIKLVDLDSEELDLDDQIDEISEDYKDFVQNQANSEEHGGFPPVSYNSKDFDDKAAKSLVDDIIPD